MGKVRRSWFKDLPPTQFEWSNLPPTQSEWFETTTISKGYRTKEVPGVHLLLKKRRNGRVHALLLLPGRWLRTSMEKPKGIPEKTMKHYMFLWAEKRIFRESLEMLSPEQVILTASWEPGIKT